MTATKCEECGSEDEHDHAACLDRQLKNVRAELAAFGQGQALAAACEPSHVFRPMPIRRNLDEPSPFERRKNTDAMCWRLVCIRLLLARSMIARHEKDRDHEIESFFAFCVELAKE